MKNSKYEFSVLVNGKSVTEFEHGADTYIEGRKGSTYELYFKNNTYNRVEVVFSVDGLSVNDGKTASDKSQGYIVDAYKSIKIPGWKIDSRKAAQFQFQPQTDKANTTYVELLVEEGYEVDAGNQGVIGCMVFVEKDKPTPNVYINHWVGSIPTWNHYYNHYEPRFRIAGSGYAGGVAGGVGGGSIADSYKQAGMSNALRGVAINNHVDASPSYQMIQNSISLDSLNVVETSMGTAFGDDVKFETTQVEFERNENHDWLAVINYDTIQGLRKRGIFIVNSPKAKAFPKFKDAGCPVPRGR